MKIIYRKWKDLWLSMIQLTPQYIQPTIIGSTVSSCPPEGCCLWYWSIHFLMNFCSIWRASLTDWGSCKIRYKIRKRTKKLFSLKRLWIIWQIRRVITISMRPMNNDWQIDWFLELASIQPAPKNQLTFSLAPRRSKWWAPIGIRRVIPLSMRPMNIDRQTDWDLELASIPPAPKNQFTFLLAPRRSKWWAPSGIRSAITISMRPMINGRRTDWFLELASIRPAPKNQFTFSLWLTERMVSRVDQWIKDMRPIKNCTCISSLNNDRNTDWFLELAGH